MEKTKMNKMGIVPVNKLLISEHFYLSFSQNRLRKYLVFQAKQISLFKCYENNFCKLCFCWCKYCLSRNLSSSRKRYRILSCINFPSAYISLACCMDIRRNYQKFKYKHRPCLVYIFNR